MSDYSTEIVNIEKPEETNVILGQSHFIKSVEDIYEAAANAGGGIRFGLAFCEASGPRLVRSAGNDEQLTELAERNAAAIGAGHCFVLLMEDGFPISILNALKTVPEVCSIYCATANPVQVLVAVTDQGRGILGVIDGAPPVGVEKEEDVQTRKEFLRTIGYKT
ncbi:MAG: adenosine-specific kinase [Bacillota bacterium]